MELFFCIRRLSVYLIVGMAMICGYPLYAEKQIPENTFPPNSLPVKVETTFYLWNLSDIDEKDGTFSAEVYVVARWQDDRLAFNTSDKPLIYTEEAARDKLREIWWPELDFVNASDLTTRNKTVFIYPDGTVEYSIKILATFFNTMDLRRFPFDKQNYEIHLQSFLWNVQVVEFVIKKIESEDLANANIKSLRPISLSAEVKNVKFQSEIYSDLGVTIHFVRNPNFFNYQILIPLLVVLFITCLMAFVQIDALSDRLLLAQGSILVLVAMKFMMNQELPTIDYLTFVDYIFFIAYFCCFLMVILSCFIFYFRERHKELASSINKHATWIPLAFFFVMYFALFFLFIKN